MFGETGRDGRVEDDERRGFASGVGIDLSFRPVMFARGRLVFVKIGAEFILRGFDKGARLGDRESVYPLFERGN